ARTLDGTLCVAQPLILPLHGGLSSAELLSMLLGDEQTGEALVQATLRELGHTAWKQYVHDGFVRGSTPPPAQVSLGSMPAFQLTPSQQGGSKRGKNELEVTYHYSSFSYDGRFANNPWLQETPDFLTKVTWD